MTYKIQCFPVIRNGVTTHIIIEGLNPEKKGRLDSIKIDIDDTESIQRVIDKLTELKKRSSRHARIETS